MADLKSAVFKKRDYILFSGSWLMNEDDHFSTISEQLGITGFTGRVAANGVSAGV